MDIQIVDNQTVTEPIALIEVKAYLQIDADYASNDSAIIVALTSARKRLESYLNIGLARRNVTVYWDGRPIQLPLSPTGDIISVKKGLVDVNPYNYTVINLPAKRISINDASTINGDWFYSMSGFVEYTPRFITNTDVYICEYQTGYEDLPGDLKQALLAECSHIFNLKGSPVTDIISPNAAMLSSSYSRNLIL